MWLLRLELEFRNVIKKGKPVIISLEFSEKFYLVSTVFAKVINALVKKESLLKNGIDFKDILVSRYIKRLISNELFQVEPKLQMSRYADL